MSKFAIVEWTRNKTLSIVPIDDIIDKADRVVGKKTIVKWNRKTYQAKVLKISTDYLALDSWLNARIKNPKDNMNQMKILLQKIKKSQKESKRATEKKVTSFNKQKLNAILEMPSLQDAFNKESVTPTESALDAEQTHPLSQTLSTPPDQDFSQPRSFYQLETSLPVNSIASNNLSMDSSNLKHTPSATTGTFYEQVHLESPSVYGRERLPFTVSNAAPMTSMPISMGSNASQYSSPSSDATNYDLPQGSPNVYNNTCSSAQGSTISSAQGSTFPSAQGSTYPSAQKSTYPSAQGSTFPSAQGCVNASTSSFPSAHGSTNANFLTHPGSSTSNYSSNPIKFDATNYASPSPTAGSTITKVTPLREGSYSQTDVHSNTFSLTELGSPTNYASAQRNSAISVTEEPVLQKSLFSSIPKETLFSAAQLMEFGLTVDVLNFFKNILKVAEGVPLENQHQLQTRTIYEKKVELIEASGVFVTKNQKHKLESSCSSVSELIHELLLTLHTQEKLAHLTAKGRGKKD